MEAVARMVNGADLPPDTASDWKARANAILTDMEEAQASMVN